jgi:hypothetical protein
MTGIRTRIDLPHRGFGMSMGNMIEMLSGEASAKQEGNWIEVEEKEPGVFAVVDDNMTVKDGDWVTENTALGFSQWDDEVEDLDAGNSDESQCFGMSSHLKWQDVDLMPEEFRAPSIERLKEALNHVAICAWCPGDI